MKKIKIQTTLFFTGLLILLTSSSIVPGSTFPKEAKINAAIESASADGKISTKEIKKIAEIAKGSSLTMKEKIALSIFGKKIGNKIIDTTKTNGEGGKSQLVALLICFFVGGIGIHRFYLGYTWQGVVQLLTLGGCGIWSLIDFIRICIGDLKPKDGEYDKTL